MKTILTKVMGIFDVDDSYKRIAKTCFAAAGLSLTNFVLHTELFQLLLLSKLRYKFPALLGKPKWISNITGTSTCVDEVVTATIGPFPELNDHNAITAGVPLPVVLKGRPPKCRYWSIQAFLKDAGEMVSGDQIICDNELVLDSEGFFTIVIGPNNPGEGTGWINSGSSTTAKMIVMRAFCVPSGTGWIAPTVLVNGKVVDFTEDRRVSGGVSLALSPVGPVSRLSRVLWFNGVLLSLFPSFAPISIAGGLGALGLAKMALRKVEKKMKHSLINVRKLIPNETVSRPAARASLGGSAKHSYFTMLFDATKSNVVVTGHLKGRFRYTSVTCYKFSALPLPGYYSDETLTPSSNHQGTYDVILTMNPTRKEGVNEIDVSSCPKGVVVVRLVYPEDEAVLIECEPKIKTLT